MIFLIRDPRDVVASWLSAMREGDWAGARRKGKLQSIGGGYGGQGHDTSDWGVGAAYRARVYFENVWGAKQAYAIHRGPKSRSTRRK
jgi:hypothetical protein